MFILFKQTSGNNTNDAKSRDSLIEKNNSKKTKIVEKSQSNENSSNKKPIEKVETNIKIIEINKGEGI